MQHDVKRGLRIRGLAFVLGLALLGSACSKTSEPKKSDAAAVANTSAVSKWEGSLVKRPAGNSVEDGKVYLVRDGKRCWVLSADWLKAHGYKFPDDVKVIPPEELDAIPLGDVIR